MINAALGLAFAWCGRERVRVDGVFAAPVFPLVLLFVGLVVAPITAYLYLVHPAWSWLYLIDPQEVPRLAVLPIMVAHSAAVVLGWYIGARFIRHGKPRFLLYGLAGTSLVAALSLLVVKGRLGAYGSYADYVAGRSLDLFDVKLGYVLVAITLGVVAAVAFMVIELLRDSRRMRAK